MAFRPSDVVGLVWHHPILSAVVLLLFTPPLFPVVVYFSPLLISTALFVLAMISMGSDHDDDSNSYSNDIPYKRVWIEEVDVDGPSLDGERVPKRLKAESSKDRSWLDKVKNWEGTGRAWVESVLSQEARKTFGPDDNAASRDESTPLLDKARGFFIDDIRKRSRETQYVPKTSSKPIEVQPTVVSSNDSPPPLAAEKSEGVAHSPRAEGVDSGKSDSEIIPELEPEELIEITPANIPPSPLFRSKSLPRGDGNVDVPADIPSEVQSKAVDSVGLVPGTHSKDGKITVSGSNAANEKNSIGPGVEQKLGDRVPAGLENGSNSAIPSPIDVSVAKGSILPIQGTATSSREIEPEITAATSGMSSTDGADRNLTEKARSNVMTEDNSDKSGGQSPTESKSAAELLAPLRQQQASSYGLGTPSAAVALSEKLKVPLADIMSLLAGEDKENVPSEASSRVKALSPSETTTTSSQEEEWSGSDVESAAPLTSLPGQSSVEKDA